MQQQKLVGYFGYLLITGKKGLGAKNVEHVKTLSTRWCRRKVFAGMQGLRDLHSHYPYKEKFPEKKTLSRKRRKSEKEEVNKNC